MNEQFLRDVLFGLSELPKKLNSKYFYDKKGDGLFQQIMNAEEYYLTNCEYEIFETRAAEIADILIKNLGSFDLIELGAGDATKSSFLLKALVEQKADFTYMPIDISGSMIRYLEETLPEEIPGLLVKGLDGEYFPMVERAQVISTRRKVVLFLGGNIGNFNLNEAISFCKGLNDLLNKGDLVLVGFDLKKNPYVIRSAYNDRTGYTRAFNLNLLSRINQELGGNFDISKFEHYNSYDPASGACRSFLFSLTDQAVQIGPNTFHFHKNEIVDMEISQKYALEEVKELGNQTNFETIETFFDSKKWFLDMLWRVTK